MDDAYLENTIFETANSSFEDHELNILSSMPEYISIKKINDFYEVIYSGYSDEEIVVDIEKIYDLGFEELISGICLIRKEYIDIYLQEYSEYLNDIARGK